MIKLRNRKLKSIPKDARKSLEVLDKVLEKYDEPSKGSNINKRKQQGGVFRRLFRPKSLEVISVDLQNNRQEDIRKSLDVLDRVLAEFDDDDSDSWLCDNVTWKGSSGVLNSHRKTTSEFDFQRSRSRYDISSSSDGGTFIRSNSTHSFQSFPTDGSTSQSAPSTFDQLRKFSPPPVPKRNPATRLSSHESLLFSSSSSSDIAVKDAIAKRRSYAEGFNYATASKSVQQWLSSERASRDDEQPTSWTSLNTATDKNFLSNQLQTEELSPRAQNSNSNVITEQRSDEGERLSPNTRRQRFASSSNDDPIESQNCLESSCLEVKPLCSSPTADMQENTATVAQRRANFEKRTEEVFQSKSSIANNPVRQNQPTDGDQDGRVVSRTNRESEVNKTVQIESNSKSTHVSASDPTTTDYSCAERAPRQREDDDGDDAAYVKRLLLLNEKFAEVRHLIKTKQITPLTTPPPSFVAPPPPKPPRKQRCVVDGSNQRGNQRPTDYINYSLPGDISRLAAAAHCPSLKSLPTSFCNGHHRHHPKLEDIPKILPADVSKIPQLGFSYSMEEDLCPGVKEILTSTPSKNKDDYSTSKSTFNSSVSSLGYGSSQSDLDLNSVSDPRDGYNQIIPVEYLKSQTLPISMKLAPDYYSELNDGTDCDSLDSYRLKKNIVSSPDKDEEHFRSSSAPPFKLIEEEDKKSKKSIFGMSKKIKNKNECNNGTSATKRSLDDGVILRRISNISDEFSIPDFSKKVNGDRGAVPLVEEKKRRSVWKSILRRK